MTSPRESEELTQVGPDTVMRIFYAGILDASVGIGARWRPHPFWLRH
jgi:hypothetical protein